MIENVLWFIAGMFVGSITGLFIYGLLTSGKTADLYMEIEDLRTQRKLLKEEIFRLSNQAKPKPRKKRSYKPRKTREKKK